jgi:hypothetical protein
MGSLLTKNNVERRILSNVTFEDDEFKEGNKALIDQGEGERELIFFVSLKLFIFNLFRLSFNFYNITSIRFVNLKTHMFAGTGARIIL